MTGLHYWVDGAIHDEKSARCAPLAQSLHYGTGVFEGIRSYATSDGPRIFRLREHIDRMQRGATCLGMTIDPEAIYGGCFAALRANKLADAYIRPISYYEGGGIGLDVDPLTPRSIVAAMPWKTHLGEESQRQGISLRTSSWRRNPATSLPPLKLCGNYVNSVIAKLEATRAGYGEALFVDERGFVCEGTGENVFLVKAGRVIAVKHPDALPGITRTSIIELSGATERPVTLTELRDADEIFLTGTSVEVTGVSRFDERDVGVGPVTRELATLYAAVVRGQAEQHRGWLAGDSE
jgi:branched-chain amino acid aminotransferase